MTKDCRYEPAQRLALRTLKTWGMAMALVCAMVGASEAATRTAIKEIVVQEALATTVPPSLALAVAKVESDFRARALSPKGARGVMQIMPATAKGEFGVGADELWNARLNVQLGIDFLARLIERYDGRWDLALSHYNSGRIKRSAAGAEPLPATRRYVDAVLRWQRRYAAQSRVWQSERSDTPSWTPAETRFTARDRPLSRRAAPSRTIIVETLPAPRRRPVSPARTHDLHDFTGNIEERRQRLRLKLDDFAGGVVRIEG